MDFIIFHNYLTQKYDKIMEFATIEGDAFLLFKYHAPFTEFEECLTLLSDSKVVRISLCRIHLIECHCVLRSSHRIFVLFL